MSYPNNLHRFYLDDVTEMAGWQSRFSRVMEKRPNPPTGLSYYGTSHRSQAAAFINLITGKPVPNSVYDIYHALETIKLVQVLYLGDWCLNWMKEFLAIYPPHS